MIDDHRPIKEPWCAYAQDEIRDERGDHMVAYVEENEPGYWPTTYTGDLAYCQAVAAEINKTRGITEERAHEIVASSMAASGKG